MNKYRIKIKEKEDILIKVSILPSIHTEEILKTLIEKFSLLLGYKEFTVELKRGKKEWQQITTIDTSYLWN